MEEDKIAKQQFTIKYLKAKLKHLNVICSRRGREIKKLKRQLKKKYQRGELSGYEKDC